MGPAAVAIEKVGPTTTSELLPLTRAYCDFYGVRPRDDQLVALSRALLDDPSEGVQLLARSEAVAVGFATIYWSWSTLDAGRVGLLHDLYVIPDLRARGVGRSLIEASREACRKRGVPKLTWDTAPDNLPAQRLYDSIGAERSSWINYEIGTW
ncbi:MAG: GNAT family N-acetyltransferase [Solirubrobacterales bacterium]